MTFSKTSSTLAVLALVLTLVTCAPNSKSEPPAEQPVQDAKSSEPAAPPTTSEVTYEPAYPEDVSEEGLTDEDVKQQEAGHSHGAGADHTHEDVTTHTPDGNDDQHQR